MPRRKKAPVVATNPTVIAKFHDIDDFTIVYEVGQDVSHLPAKRIATLAEKGLISTGLVAEQEEPDNENDFNA